MAFLMDSLGLSNPFGTQIGQLIEKATEGEQVSENWALLLEICDIINETEDGPKDAMRAVRKRLQQAAGKNNQMLMFTLTVVETCVKNCGHRFHVQVASKDFLQDLVKLIGPKNDPPQILQERVLSLVQTWADAFSTAPDLKEVGRVYQELKSKGVEFPMTDLDNLAPIHTPARSFPDSDSTQYQLPSAKPVSQPPSQTMNIPRAVASHPVPPNPAHLERMVPQPGGALSVEQTAKLRRDLDVVYQNCFVFNDMLTELTPGQEKAEDLLLLQELNETCRQMQNRVMELIQQVQNEEITGELLRVNDDLLNSFVRYDRFERQRRAQAGGGASDDERFSSAPPTYENAATLPLHPRTTSSAHAQSNVGNLIDFDAPTSNDRPSGDENIINASLANLNVTGGQTQPVQQRFDDDFDMFAQSRQSFEQNQKQLASGAAYRNQQEDKYNCGLGSAMNAKVSGAGYNQTTQLPHTDDEYEEMAKWLQQNPRTADHVSSSEFDEFLSERAKNNGHTVAGDQTSSPGNHAHSSPGRLGRQLNDSDGDNSLFAL